MSAILNLPLMIVPAVLKNSLWILKLSIMYLRREYLNVGFLGREGKF